MSGHTRIVIAGSRSITNYNDLLRGLQEAINKNIFPLSTSFEIVSGGAKGVDILARRYAQDTGYKLTEFIPDWNHGGKYDPTAGFQRNGQMAAYGDILIAIYDGESRGTANMISHMKRLGKPYYVHIVK